MKYKDKEGKILYGYSQQNLENNTFWLKLLVSVLFCFLLLLLYVLYQFMHYDIWTNTVRIVAGCSRCG